MPLYKSVDLWYNKCKGNSKKQAKTLHIEGGYVSIQQWANQSGGFQAADRDGSERKQPLGEESPDDPVV